MLLPNIGRLESATPAVANEMIIWQNERAYKSTITALLAGSNIRITDSANGKTYSLGSTNGTLELVEV